MKVQCPKCNRTIDSEQINTASDIAHCNLCNEIFKLSELLESSKISNFDINIPPNGTSLKREMNKNIITASTRSWIALFIVPFMIVWSGGSIGGIYGRQILSGEFDLFQSLIGIPFLIGTIVFGSFAIMTVMGKVVVEIDSNNGKIFTGVGNIGWTRRFQWNEIQIIREEKTNFSYPGGYNNAIILEGKTRIKFGTNLNEKRRYFVIQALKHLKQY